MSQRNGTKWNGGGKGNDAGGSKTKRGKSVRSNSQKSHLRDGDYRLPANRHNGTSLPSDQYFDHKGLFYEQLWDNRQRFDAIKQQLQKLITMREHRVVARIRD